MTSLPPYCCWKRHQWPAIDQLLWDENCRSGDVFDDPVYASTLRPVSQAKAAKGYGRLLCFLETRGWLDPNVQPIERISPQRLRAFYRELRSAGNADYTIIGRCSEIHMAMKILAPQEDVSWIRRIGSRTVYSSLEKRKRHKFTVDNGVLEDWAYDMMDQAETKPTHIERLCALRDGLMLAMLAARARRLRSMALLRVSEEIFRNGDTYRIELAPHQVKTNRADRFDLPLRLTPYIERYLQVVRPALLAGHESDTFWIGARGGAWTEKAIQSQVLALTRKRFGVAFGPHRARHCLVTTAATLDPENAGLAAGVLNVSFDNTQDHYNLGNQIKATLTYDEILERRRRDEWPQEELEDNSG